MNTPRATKDWIRAVAEYLHLSLSELAVKAGLSPSTVTRYINDATGKLTITERTLDAIATFSGVAKHVLPGQRGIPGLGDSEAVTYHAGREGQVADWVASAIDAHRAGRNGVEPWIMKSYALDLMGILPGDILMIDRNRRAKAGDIVCAQLTDLATGRAETVIRRYDPPYIVTLSAKIGPTRPEVVDDERVVILGVETGMIRPRH